MTWHVARLDRINISRILGIDYFGVPSFCFAPKKIPDFSGISVAIWFSLFNKETKSVDYSLATQP
ncbi:hypothetical protein HMPREF3095_04065 [Lactobacillus sp. HMSC25A02]|jgi:hypothetical protein|nr:hypothetical protein [Lacticaseibacillus paracasei]OFS06700.1 hypothetical protein HMPREF3095_04065 [Lactobacillus sp. HMSC25A02]PTS48609.1 hypothetical protein DBQ60_12320 [Lactobacillus sp. DS2_6]MCT3370008.1 hypothetical protein [Lacticaseibacillus paracasei]MED7626487.1 hypothetical protein [Lacticaseibacillus paracasei]